LHAAVRRAAAARRPCSNAIDISCNPRPQQQTRRTLLQGSMAGRQARRRTDGQTDTVPAAHYAGRVNNPVRSTKRFCHVKYVHRGAEKKEPIFFCVHLS